MNTSDKTWVDCKIRDIVYFDYHNTKIDVQIYGVGVVVDKRDKYVYVSDGSVVYKMSYICIKGIVEDANEQTDNNV